MRPRLIAEALLLLALAAVPIRAAEVPQLLADINQTQPPPNGLFLPVPSSPGKSAATWHIYGGKGAYDFGRPEVDEAARPQGAGY